MCVYKIQFSTQVGTYLADEFGLLPTEAGTGSEAGVLLTCPYVVSPLIPPTSAMTAAVLPAVLPTQRHRLGLFPSSNNAVFARRMIVITQPRKLAARTLAERVASEWGCRLGEEIGYDCGSDHALSDRTIVKFVTDKVLMNESISDPMLSLYKVVLIDEGEAVAHYDPYYYCF